jgi:hypothetical protein
MVIEKIMEIKSDHRLVFDLPFDLPIGKAKVKLSITPEKHRTVTGTDSVFGCLQHFSAPDRMDGEKNAWIQAVIGKHAKN